MKDTNNINGAIIAIWQMRQGMNFFYMSRMGCMDHVYQVINTITKNLQARIEGLARCCQLYKNR